MKNNSFEEKFIVTAIVIVIIGCIYSASEPRCARAGCSNRCAKDNNYCYLHTPYKESGSSSTSGSNSTSGSSSTGGSTSTGTNHKYSYDSYDEGYDDIYFDEDYDYDRYDKDSDYADGVDDAMDDLEEDW